MQAHLPIAVFDSGVGGLTVVQALHALLPQERIVYLGDTARLPYGTKSPAVVQRYAVRCADFLLRQGVKMLVVACNTASAFALAHLQEHLPIPVIGVITPSAGSAVRATQTKHIGVIATEGTVQSGSYERCVAELAPDVRVSLQACPMLVPLAEENLVAHPATRMLAQEYLAPLLARGIDTLVLGCTHYPLLRKVLTDVCGPRVTLVDCAHAVATEVRAQLEHHTLLAPWRSGDDIFFATDVSQRLLRIGTAFLGRPMQDVTWVDI